MTNDNARGKEQLYFQIPDGVYDVVREKIMTHSLNRVSMDAFLRHNICGMLQHNLGFKYTTVFLKVSRTFEMENCNNKHFLII